MGKNPVKKSVIKSSSTKRNKRDHKEVRRVKKEDDTQNIYCNECCTELDTIYDGIIDGLIIVDIKTRKFHKVNKIMQTMLGYPEEELLTMGVENVHPPDTVKKTINIFNTMTGAGPFRYEGIEMVRKDGTVFLCEINTRKIKYKGKKCLIGFFRDITEQMRIKDDLQWELHVNKALSELYKPLISHDASIKNIAYSVLKKATSLTGSEHGFVSIIDSVSGDNSGYALSKIMANQYTFEDKIQHITFPIGPDGRYQGLRGHCLNTLKPFYTNDPASHESYSGVPRDQEPLEQFLSVPVLLEDKLVGQITLANPGRDYTDRDMAAIVRIAGFYALALQRMRFEEALKTSRDNLNAGVKERTTELTRALSVLRQSERRFRGIFDSAFQLIGIINRDGTVLELNKTALDIFGQALHEITGMKLWDINLWITASSLKKIIRNAISDAAKGRFVRFTVDGTDKHGRSIIIDVSFKPVYDEKGNVAVIIAEGRDITDMKNAEKALIESESKYRTVANFTHDWEYWINPDSTYQYVSPSCKAITGYSADEFLADGSLMLHIIHPDDLPLVKNHLGIISEYDTSCSINGLDFRIITKDGTVRWISHRCQPVYTDDGTWAGQRGSHRDITLKKQAEVEIKRLNTHIIKLQEEERRRVAKDLHDSVGQLIMAARLNLGMFKDDPAKYTDRLEKGLMLIDSAAQELREIYTDLFPSILDDIGLIETIEWYARNVLQSRGIQVTMDLENDLKFSEEQQVNIYRIIQELFANIIKHSGATFVNISMKNDKRTIILSVQDNGSGFDLNKIKTGKHGYGLANIRQRAETIGSELTINSSPGKGMKVTLKIQENGTQ